VGSQKQQLGCCKRFKLSRLKEVLATSMFLLKKD